MTKNNQKDVKVCRVCGVELDDENWYPSFQKSRNYICKECQAEKQCSYQDANRDKVNAAQRLYRKENPEKSKEYSTIGNRKNGHLPMSENKKCSSYFGVYVNERFVKHYFDDVEVMPMNNPGYDFVCNKDKKIDGKSSCLHKNGQWTFNIRHNTIADYFMLVAYDDRDDLNPLHIWLIPGNVLNHLMVASIRPSTLDKWKEYEQNIDDAVLCCDAMKEQ